MAPFIVTMPDRLIEATNMIFLVGAVGTFILMIVLVTITIRSRNFD